MPTQTSDRPISVAIIGAGLAGTVLALTLHSRGLTPKLYELRPRDKNTSIGGSISLQPNGLRVLDAIGVYARVLPQGCSMDGVCLHNVETGATTTEGEGLEAAYGYQGLRLRRDTLIKELRDAVEERGIEVVYDFRFASVVSEDSTSGVTFAGADGAQHAADVLVGADGIHSAVRSRHVAPGVEPEYQGLLGLGTSLPTSALRLPTDPEDPCSRLPLNLRGGGGMFAIIPEVADRSSVALLSGAAVPGRSREGWEALFADTRECHRLFRAGLDAFPDVVQSALEAVPPTTRFIPWPVHHVPRLDSWLSPGRRVLVLGDAAHALSPATGQGANSAFEDAYMLGLALAAASGRGGASGDAAAAVDAAVEFWHGRRRERVYSLTERLLGKQAKAEGKDPIELRSKGAKGDNGRGDQWLYGIDLKREVDEWAEQNL